MDTSQATMTSQTTSTIEVEMDAVQPAPVDLDQPAPVAFEVEQPAPVASEVEQPMPAVEATEAPTTEVSDAHVTEAADVPTVQVSDLLEAGATGAPLSPPIVSAESSALVETTLAPVDTSPALMETTPIPVDTAPAPVDTAPAPVEANLAFVEVTPAPACTAEEQSKLAVDASPSSVIDTTPTGPLPATEEQPTFFVDTTPTPVTPAEAVNPRHDAVIDAPTTAPRRLAQLTKSLQDEDEIIVYVAPHPRSGRATPAPGAPSVVPPMTSMLTGTTQTLDTSKLPSSSAPGPSTPSSSNFAAAHTTTSTAHTVFTPLFSFADRQGTRQPRHAPAVTPDGRARQRIRERQKHKKRGRRPKGEWGTLGFGAFGAMHEDELWAPDPRYAERRRGDSDLEWGSDDEEGEAQDGVAEGMALDVELVEDKDAMRSFVDSMGPDGQRHVTMDDIRDGEILRAEDEAVSQRGSGSESESSSDDDGEADMEAVFAQEEMQMLGESDEEEESSDDSSEDGDSPGTSFRKRLERMRAAKGKQRATPAAAVDDSDDEDVRMEGAWEGDDDYEAMDWTNADGDEAFLDHVEALLAQNQHLLKGKGKKRHDKLFDTILNGSFEIDEDDLDDLAQFNKFTASKRKKEKYQHLPKDLQEQWENDRAKKAANKRARQLARMQLAADPLAPKKGGKKMKKAIAAAAREIDPDYGQPRGKKGEVLPGTIHVLPNRVIDMTTLVVEVRRFIADLGRSSMSLPPAGKETRKKIHEVATAFNLKSHSKGKGEARYTTLTRTSRTGYMVNERKIGKIVRGAGAAGGMFGSSSFVAGGEGKGKKGKGGGGGVPLPRHREGETVGGTAPKIDGTNVGFRMLASMGWQDGDRIGATGGLEAPLTAIMKTTKLGLGATR